MITDAVLLGSLHNYRLWLLRHGWGEGGETETGVGREGKGGEGAGAGRLGIGGQAVAGWGAGMSKWVTRFAYSTRLLHNGYVAWDMGHSLLIFPFSVFLQPSSSNL
jgi:hypothetical protein